MENQADPYPASAAAKSFPPRRSSVLKIVQTGKPGPRSCVKTGHWSIGHVPSLQNLTSAWVEKCGRIAKETTRAIEAVILNMLIFKNGVE